MTNGDQVQGSGGGQRTYSEEDVLALMNETAKRAVAEATKAAEATRVAEAAKNPQRINEDEDDNNASVINPKVVRQLKDTVAVFTALKDLSSNPLQKTIEETVGGMAASVVQSAFSPRGPPPKQDIVDKLLNSQFAYGLGSGLGQRAPELVETMGRTFGTEKAGQMMDNIIGKYGTTGGQSGQSRQINPGPSSGSSGPQSPPEQKTDKQQSEKELLLSLDPNNPEHVSAYAETQGGLPVDVARKMLMIHQDAFMEQLKRDGMNIDQISTQRGSRAQSSPPVQQPSSMQQAPPVQPVPPSSMGQDIPPNYPDNYPGSHTESPSSHPSNNIEYVEYRDVAPDSPNLNQQSNGQQTSTNSGDGKQVEMMKTFATDIGKVMGDMLNKIESLNNTVFTLQSEMNDMKIQGSKYPQDMTDTPITMTPSNISPPILTNQQQNKVSAKNHGNLPLAEHLKPSITTHVKAPSLEIFEDKVIEPQGENLNIERSGDFFEENVIDTNNFRQELEEDAKLPVQKTQQQTPPAHVAQTVLPAAHITEPIVQQPIIQHIQDTHPQVVQLVQPIIQQTDKENNDDKGNNENKDNIDAQKNGSIAPESEELNKIPIISDNKTSEETNDNNFVTPTNQQLNKEPSAKNHDNIPKAGSIKLSKNVGIHKKTAYRNIKPSFKKNDKEENKEDSDI